ncbi:hypothetical protein JKP88DRAFT_241485 [Tribonema minus]|uniref:Uncharacterized protein n=1 Tax=Tribonema minus TaxID=303371 RepID=A0A835YV16_9STRA|nr:hypothetical protein JKP88DRAFT_241485 [Tribonema minus]
MAPNLSLGMAGTAQASIPYNRRFSDDGYRPDDDAAEDAATRGSHERRSSEAARGFGDSIGESTACKLRAAGIDNYAKLSAKYVALAKPYVIGSAANKQAFSQWLASVGVNSRRHSIVCFVHEQHLFMEGSEDVEQQRSGGAQHDAWISEEAPPRKEPQARRRSSLDAEHGSAQRRGTATALSHDAPARCMSAHERGEERGQAVAAASQPKGIVKQLEVMERHPNHPIVESAGCAVMAAIVMLAVYGIYLFAR